MAYIEYEIKRKMMYDYLAELDSIQGNPPASNEEREQWYNSLAEYGIDGIAKWIDIKRKDKIVGQLIICRFPECHPDADYFISQSYVIPKARKQGLMTKTVKEFVATHPGTYCMFVFKRNIYAFNFWTKLFSELGYEQIQLKDVGACESNSIQLGFKKKKI